MITSKPPANHPRFVKTLRIWQRRCRERLLTVLLAIQVFTVFVMPSLRAAGMPIPHSALFVFLLIFTTVAIILSQSKIALVIMLFSVAFTVVGFFWHHEHPDFETDAVNAVGQILAQACLLWVVATAVFGRGPTTYHRILGAVVMYLSIGMIFTSLYIFLAQTLPDAFTHVSDNLAKFGELRTPLTYFSFSTLTTSSFGDILPLNPIARSLANLEAICGQLFPATLLARIVSLHGSRTN